MVSDNHMFGGCALRIALRIILIIMVLLLVNGTSFASEKTVNFKHSKIQSVTDSAIQATSINGLSNSWITLTLYDNGQFTLKNTSNEKLLLYPSSTSFISINIDGNIYIQGTGSASSAIGVSSLDNYISTPLTKVNQDFSYINYSLPGNIRIIQKFELYGNTVKFSTEAINLGTNSHNVKVRYLLDTQLDRNDGSPLYASTVGVKTYEIDIPNPSFSNWKGYDIYPNPNFESIGTLSTQPYRMVFAWWPNSVKSAWDYTPNSNQRFYTPRYTSSPESDSSVLFYWDLGAIAPSEQRSISTFYGTGTPNIGTDLNAIDSALDYYKNKVNLFYDDFALSSAEADAKLYKKYPNLNTDVTNYFGYKSGVLGESVVANKLKNTMNSLNIPISADEARINYLFLKEMYSKVDQTMSEAQITNIFYAYYMGTASNQQHFLMGNTGIAQLKVEFNDNFTKAKEIFLQSLKDKPLSQSEINILATGLTNSAESVDDFKPLYQNYRTIAQAYQEDRVTGSLIYQTEFSGIGGSQAHISNSNAHLNMDPIITPVGISFIIIYTPIIVPMIAQTTVSIGGLISSTYSHLLSSNLIAPSAEISGATTISPSNPVPQQIPPEMDIIKTSQDPIIINKLKQEFLNKGIKAYENAEDALNTARELIKIDSINIEEITLTDITSPSDSQGKIGWSKGTIKVKNNGIETVNFSLTWSIDGPSKSDFAIEDNIISLRPGESRVIPITYAVSLSELSDMRICGRYILTITPIIRVSIPIPGLSIGILNPYTRFLYEVGVPIKVSAEVKGIQKSQSFYAGDSILGSTSANVISDGNLVQGKSVSTQYSTQSNTARLGFLLPYPGSDIDLHVYDSQGHHVGVNYNTGQIENNIPGAEYSGSTSNPEWISVDQTGINSYTVKAVAIQTNGNESYSIVAVESPELPPLVGLNPSSMLVSTLPNTTLNYDMTINEYGGFNSLTEFNIKATNFSNERGEIIPYSNISFDIPQNSISVGSSVRIGISVIVPDNISYGLYSGTINIDNNSGMIDSSSVYIDVTDPEVTQYDSNGNGRIERNEAIQAVVDYFNSAIQKPQASKVVLSYFRTYPVI